MEKISVVIPLYNKEQYIYRTIMSVLSQNVLPDEVLVIDDGSTDSSVKQVKRFSDPRVRLILQENQGECGARNRGIKEARNKFIAFLDGDDEWKEDFLEQIMKLIRRFPGCGAYATSSEIIKPNGRIVYPDLSSLPSQHWIGIIPNFFELFQSGYAFNASSIVIPKQVLEEIGGFPIGVQVSGDVACWVNIAIRYSIAFSTSYSVIYHQEAQNRVGHIYKPLIEMPYIQSLRIALDSNSVAPRLKPEAYEFMAQKQIMVAVQNVMAGNSSYARQLLSTCSSTRKYRRYWLWWRLWASLPNGWPYKLMQVKQRIRKQVYN